MLTVVDDPRAVKEKVTENDLEVSRVSKESFITVYHHFLKPLWLSLIPRKAVYLLDISLASLLQFIVVYFPILYRCPLSGFSLIQANTKKVAITNRYPSSQVSLQGEPLCINTAK